MTTRRSAQKVEPTIVKKKQSRRERAGLCVPPYAAEHKFRAKMGHKKSLARDAPVFVAGAAEALLRKLLEDALAIAGDGHRVMVRHLAKPLADSGRVYGSLLPSRVENVRAIDMTQEADAKAYRQQRQDNEEEEEEEEEKSQQDNDVEAMDESGDDDDDEGNDSGNGDDSGSA